MGENRQVEAPSCLAAPPGLERQRFDSHFSTPPELNIVWISPRRSGHIADVLMPQVSSTHLLHTFLTRSEPSISTLASADLVLFDLAANLRFHLE